MKKHIVFWSGGADSTALLYNLAKEAELGVLEDYDKESEEKPIFAYSLNVSSIQGATLDKFCRGMIKAEFERKGLDKYIQFVEKEYYDPQKDGLWLQPGGYPRQQWLWLGELVGKFLIHDCTIHLGYIKGDCYWQTLHPIVKGFIKLVNEWEPEIKVDIKHDLWSNDKRQIFNILRNAGLLEVVSMCENPEQDEDENYLIPCNNCSKCKDYNEYVQIYGTAPDPQEDKVEELTEV